jgi:hypothetical protein
MPITNRAPGYYSKSKAEANLRFALSRLKISWRQLNLKDLESHLRHLILAERKCMPHRNGLSAVPMNRWLQPRLRWRRLDVAMHLVKQGGRVSNVATSRVLPKGAWPGVISLVGKQAKEPLASPAEPPNPSVKGTATSGLRPLASAPYVERYAS